MVVLYKNRGLANGAAIHSEWDRAGGAGVAGCRLPALWPRATRPPHTLRWLQRQVLNLPRPRLQEGRPRHGASQ